MATWKGNEGQERAPAPARSNATSTRDWVGGQRQADLWSGHLWWRPWPTEPAKRGEGRAA